MAGRSIVYAGADPGKRKGVLKVSSVDREKIGVSPTSGAVRLGKIPFSARGRVPS